MMEKDSSSSLAEPGPAEGGPEAALGADAGRLIAEARVLVVGVGGVGGVVAHEFGRLGAAGLTLVDFDRYCASNLNRQVACFEDSLGKPKAEVLAADIRRMGRGTAVRALVERRPSSGFAREIAEADLVIAAADDYAFSLALMDRCLEAGKPCGAALPVGAWAALALFTPGGPAPASLFGFRVQADEEAYAREIGRSRSSLARRILVRSGGEDTRELEAFASGEASPPQLCPVVWSAASLLVLEATRLLAGLPGTVLAPRYTELGAGGPRVRLSIAALLAPRGKRRKGRTWQR